MCRNCVFLSRIEAAARRSRVEQHSYAARKRWGSPTHNLHKADSAPSTVHLCLYLEEIAHRLLGIPMKATCNLPSINLSDHRSVN